MDDVQQTNFYDENTGVMHTKHTYDSSEVKRQNRIIKNEQADLGMGRYKSKNSQLVKVGNIHMGDVVKLRELGYNLISDDPDEVQRALLFVQTHCPDLMTVSGTPIAKKKEAWI